MSTSTPQISSIKAIDAWVAIINGNMGGLVRTGYKRVSPSFVGGGARSERLASGGATLGVQFPEATMRISSQIDFSQGPLMGSTSLLHMAVNGPGFFPVVPPNSLSPVLYTRDGEFRLQDLGGGQFALVNPQGLRLFLPGPPVATLATTTLTDPETVDPYNLSGGRALEIAVPPAPNDALRYSSFGATAFEPVTGAGPIPVFALDPANRPKFLNGATSLGRGLLEASNADVNALIPELSMAQKAFVAITKLLQAQNERYENIFSIIR